MGREAMLRAREFRKLRPGVGSEELSDVAFSGSYTDLRNQPSIPPQPVNADWSASVGLSAILNKPTLFTGAYADLTGQPTIPAAQVQSDWSATAGMGVILNKPTVPKVAYYTVATNASGVWSVSISGFTAIYCVHCVAGNTATTAAGARIATLTNYSLTSATGTVCAANSITSILGLLGLGLSGAGVSVMVRVEGI